MRHIFLGFFLFFAQLSSYAQYLDFSFEHLTTDDGLSNDIVNSIVKDKTGFMWFGTNDGLNRYDGRNFHVLRSIKNDSLSLPSNFIGSMTLDKEGWIWISTNRGLCKFSPDNNQFIMVPFPGNDRKKDILLSNVVFSQDNFAWFICDKYLYKMDPKSSAYKRFELPTAERYFLIKTDKKGRIWVYLRNALYQFFEKTGEFRYYGGMNNLNPTDPRSFGPPVITSSDTLLISTYGDGFLYYDETTDRFLRWKKNAHLVIHAIEDKTYYGRKFFWCIGGTTGLMIYDPEMDKYHSLMNNPRDPYTHNATDGTTMFKDPDTGTMWIGTKAGVEKFDPYSLRFKRKFLPPSIGYSSFALIGEVIKDKTDQTGNTYWAGSWAMGLFKWTRDDNEFRVFNMDDGIASHEVFHVSQSKFGYLIIACRDGVTLFDPRTEKVIKNIKDFFVWPISRKILYATEDENGDIWMVANYDGIYQYQKSAGKIKHWDLPGVKPEDGPFLLGNIQTDKNNKIWVSGFNGVLYIIDPLTGIIKLINDAGRKGTKLPGAISTLHINKRTNEIWVSGTGNYLAQLDENGEVLRIINEKDGEDGNGYVFLLQDPLGYLWASADKYVQRIDPKNGARDFFEKDDGLVGTSAIYGASMTPEGELFLGFQYAFCHINTLRIPFNKQPPIVAISSSKVNYSTRYLGATKEIVLNPDEKVLTLEFAALNYSQPSRNRFAYKLDGYDKDWVFANDHDITLMNLEGGTHLLHVKASNNDGVWSDEMQMKIKVIPPFHKTIWFKLLIAILIGVLAYLINWSRKEQRKKLEKIRQRIATDLHDDMGSTLSSIRIFSDVARKQVQDVNPETVPLLDRISNNATSLSENMQDIIWTIRSDNDTLEDLVSRMREFGLRVCDAKHIMFKVQVSQNFKTSKLNLEQRRNLYLIFKEVINNAVKYAEPTQINLFLTQQGRYLKMQITDNGKGFDVERVKRGNGLNNMEKRAKEINGDIRIESQPGKGTSVDLMVVLKKTALDA